MATTVKYTKTNHRPLAVVTGASSGIGYYLAKECAENGFDLLIVADDPKINDVARDFPLGTLVDAIESDLATTQGVDELVSAINGRRVKALFANVGHGLGYAFLDQDFTAVRGERYPVIVKLWRQAWDQFTPFLAFPPDVRRVVYTTRSRRSTARSARRSRPEDTSPPRRPPAS